MSTFSTYDYCHISFTSFLLIITHKSLKDIGKISAEIGKASAIMNSKVLDVTGKQNGLVKIVNGLDDLEDVALMFNQAGIDKTLAKSTLEASNFSKQLGDVVDETTGLNKLDKTLDGLTDSPDIVDDMGNAFKGAGQKIGSFLKTAGPMLLFAAAVAGTAIAIKNYYEKFDKLVETAETSQNAYSDTATEVKNLQSEIDSTAVKIQELEAQGELTITEQGELERLRNQNLELERQKKLKEEIAVQQSKQATNDAMEALTLERTQDLTQKNRISGSSRHDFVDQTEYKQTNVVTATKNEIAALEKLKEERNKLLNDDIDDSSQTDLFDSLDSEIDKYESEISNNLESITALRNNFIDQSTGLLKENLTAEQKRLFYDMTKAIDDYNNIDLTGAEKELKKIESFFDGSTGKNRIKEYLLEATENGMSASVAIERLGIDLESAGLDAQTLNEYFQEMCDSAEEAKDSVQDYASTVSDIEVAGESDDQDKNWSTVSEAYKKAKELLKEGKTGTDDFQAMASFLNPEKVKELAEEGGKYTADAYQKAFEEVTKTANRWFGEDETKSMENFVNDFKKKGLFDVKTDEMGLWDITTNFETTAEAADKFGMSIESVETMLEALGAYGYEFEGITFSADALSEYESYLEGIQNLYDELEDSDLKDRLKGILDKAELDDFENNIEKLSPEIVAEIEFAYDLAQIDQEIQRLKAELSGAGYNDSSSNAEIIAANEARTNKWREENSKATKDAGYAGTDETIAKLERSMVGKSDDEIESIQRKVMALQDLRTAYENVFDASNGNISWEEFIGSAEADKVFSDLAEEFGIAKSDLEQIASEGVEVSVAGNTTSFYDKLTGVLSNDGKTIVMHIDATTEQIQNKIDNLKVGQRVVFNAEVNGEDTSISAYRDINGVIRYVAEDDGVLTFLEEHQNPDGTITYTPDTDAVDAYDYDQDGVVEYIGKFPKEAPTLYGTAKYDLYINSRNGSIPKLTGSELYDGVASGTMLSPARKDGTAYNVLNTLPLSAYASGRVGLPRDERALVNEEYINGHSESIVRDGVWRLIPGGAHLENLKQGDLIFSAQQTEDLLRSGKTPGHARAFAQGNVLASAYRLGNNTGGSSGENSKDNKTKTSTKNQPEKFDWVERKIQKVQRAIEKLDKIVNFTYKTWTTRNEALTKEISKVNDEIDIQEKAYREYIKEANSVGLDKKYRDLVRDGKIDIQTIKNDKLKEKIQEYQEWIDKARECKDAIAELEETEASLYQQRFDNVSTKYDSILERYDYRQSMHEELIAQNEAKGQPVSGRYYQSMIHAEEDRLEQLKKEREELYDAFEKGMDADGNPIKRGSEAWREMLNTINETTVEIEKSETAILEFEKTIRELDWANFDLLQERISNVTAESDFLIKVMSDEKMHDEKGNLTDEGLATMGLHAQNYEAYLLQAERYAKEIARLDKSIAKNPYNQDLIDRRQELLGLQRDSILASEDEKAAIVDMVQSGIDLEIDALQDVIDKQKERLDSAKDLYDYQKKINNLTKEHSSIQKQILAYSGDDSEENRARLQQLQVKLEESQENLRDAEYEKYLSDHKELLDSLQTEYTDVLNERMDNIDALFSEMLDKVDANRSDILRTLTEQASGVGTTISDSISDVWANGKTVIAGLQTTVNTISVDLKNMLDSLLFDARTDAQQVTGENAFNSYEAGLGATTFNFVSIVDDKKGKVEKISSKNEINDILSDSKIKQIKKINGYATGAKRIDEDQLAWLNENGNLESIIRQRDGAILRPLSEGDRVLDAATTEKLYNLALDPTKYFAENIGIDRLMSSISSIRNNGESVNNINVDLTINAPNITDTETLIYEIKHNKEIERTFLAMTADRMIGKSHLRKY